MVIDQEILINCTDNNKKINGKVIRLFRGGLDVAIKNTIIKMNLKKNNVYVGNLHGLEFTFIDEKIMNNSLSVKS